MTYVNKFEDANWIRENASQDETGAWFWHSNENYLFNDCLEKAGIDFDSEAQDSARSKANEKFISEYREFMETYEYSDEEKAGMRAAFGEGAEVVNIVTGKKIQL